MSPVASISVDLDSVACYYRIHGLGPAPELSRHAVMTRCLPRFLDLLERRCIRATFFVVGEDVDHLRDDEGAAAARDALREAVARGHELGNHTYRHRYDLTRLPPDTIEDEIERAHALLGDLAGEPVVGFRSPGYGISGVVLKKLVALGYRYDSSVLPSPPYYLGKAILLLAMALVGRRSESIMTEPRALIAPSAPYVPRADSPWRRGDSTLVQLPIAVTRWLRTPLIGTWLLTVPRWLRSHWLDVMHPRAHLNLTFHGIDLVDVEEDSISRELVVRQPGLRTPLARRLRNLEELLDDVGVGYPLLPLREVAERVRSAPAQRRGRRGIRQEPLGPSADASALAATMLSSMEQYVHAP